MKAKMIFTAIIVIALISALSLYFKWFGVTSERIVFQNSHQYKEAQEQRSAIIESQIAEIAEIDAQIIKHPEKRQELLAQRKVLELKLKSYKELNVT